jgi:transposase
MRGADTFTDSLFKMRKLEDFVPADHPLRTMRTMSNEALAKMSALFAVMHEAEVKGGRPSIAPKKLLRAMLLQVLYSVRSERQLMEQVQYNLLFRWFIGLSMDDAVWVPTVSIKNRERVSSTTPPSSASTRWWRLRKKRFCCRENTSAWTAR